MLKIAICDDMLEFLQHAKQTVEQWPNRPAAMLVELFTDGDALIGAHSASPFDIIFLDVLMPLVNGIETAAEIRQQDKSVKIVFLTSSPEYAVDSYRVKANNYLLKPLESQKLFACLDELTEEVRQQAKTVMVKGRHAVHRVELQNIEYVESDNKYVRFALADGNVLTSTNPLYMYEKSLLLEDGFFKCHRSYVVNIHKIKSFTHKEITMQSGWRVPIARNSYKEFEAAYFSAVFGRAGEL